jgi:UDPglucose 6-dehydrogenase
MVRKIEQALGGNVAGKTIAILGLTFKPETDDMRESPALAILPKLLEAGANLKACDPQGIPEAKKILPKSIQYCDDVESAVASADAIVLMTEWKQFHNLDLASLKNIMKGDVFIDLRNIYERDQMLNAGFKYHCVGR